MTGFSSESKRRHIYVVNELNALGFIFRAIMGQTPYLLAIDPIVPGTKGLLDKLTKWAIDSKRSLPAIDLVPHMQRIWEYRIRLYFLDVFKNYESWQNAYYGFDLAEATDPEYGYAYKQLTCVHVFGKAVTVFLLNAVTSALDDTKRRVHGIPRDTLDMTRAYFGPDSAQGVQAVRLPRRFINGLLALVSLTAALGWIVSRVRFSIQTQSVPVAFDLCKDNREYELLSELSCVEPIVLVDRFPSMKDRPLPESLETIRCTLADGIFRPNEARKAISELVSDLYTIWRTYRRLLPAHFYRVLALPYKRLRYRALFLLYQPDVFIGRDEYNVDHILRRRELGRLGGRSIGLSNAFYPPWTTYAPNIRYISYDEYFVFSAPAYAAYADTWAADMKVVSSGGYALPRDMLTSLRTTHGEDIVFTMRIGFSNPEMVRMVRAVAAAFPNRRVLLQFKGGAEYVYVSEEETRAIVEECRSNRPNVSFTTADVYDLLKRAHFHISDVSTVVAESIQAGIRCFFADLLEMEYCWYRNLPWICVQTADELVDKMRHVEMGTAIYPHDEYLERMDLSRDFTIYDALHATLNLPTSSVHKENSREAIF